MAKTYDEQLADIKNRQKELDVKLKERQKQLKAQEKKILARKNAAEQKAHNKRIYEIGKAVEKAIDKPLEEEDMDALKNYINEQSYWFQKALTNI